MPRSASPMSSPLLFMVLLSLASYFAISIIQTMSQSYLRHQQLVYLERDVAQLQRQKESLAQELKNKQATSFIEGEARNKLGLARPNEVVVIFPVGVQTLGASTSAKPQATTQPAGVPTTVRQWQHLFWQ